MRYLIISASLHPESRSRSMARFVHQALEEAGHVVAWLDLREHMLPLCDGADCYGHPNAAYCKELIEQADGVVLASSVYNFDLNAAAKNLLEITGQAWSEKVVGFLCAAGGHSSYMGVMGVANSLMLDFRTFVLPRFVYAVSEDFTDTGELRCDDIRKRLQQLSGELVRVTSALRVPL